jgi:hypothetical protein
MGAGHAWAAGEGVGFEAALGEGAAVEIARLVTPLAGPPVAAHPATIKAAAISSIAIAAPLLPRCGAVKPPIDPLKMWW